MKIEAMIRRVRARRAGWVKYRVTLYAIGSTEIVPLIVTSPMRYTDALSYAEQHATVIVYDEGAEQ